MGGGAMLTDGAWMDLEPLIEACRPKGKTPPQDIRRTLSAILWRHQNGAKWRAIPGANVFHHGGLSRTGLMVHHPTSTPYPRRRRASEGRCPPLFFGIVTPGSGSGA